MLHPVPLGKGLEVRGRQAGCRQERYNQFSELGRCWSSARLPPIRIPMPCGNDRIRSDCKVGATNMPDSQDFCSIEDALAELKAGRMVVLVDDEQRENEGDIAVAAENASPDAINFMMRNA